MPSETFLSDLIPRESSCISLDKVLIKNYSCKNLTTNRHVIEYPPPGSDQPLIWGGLLSFHFLYKMCIKNFFQLRRTPFSRVIYVTVGIRMIITNVTELLCGTAAYSCQTFSLSKNRCTGMRSNHERFGGPRSAGPQARFSL